MLTNVPDFQKTNPNSSSILVGDHGLVKPPVGGEDHLPAVSAIHAEDGQGSIHGAGLANLRSNNLRVCFQIKFWTCLTWAFHPPVRLMSRIKTKIKLNLSPVNQAGELVQCPGVGGGDASLTGRARELDLVGFGDEQGAVKSFDPGPAEQQGGDEGNLPAVSDAHAQAGGGVHGPCVTHTIAGVNFSLELYCQISTVKYSRLAWSFSCER